MKKFILMSGLPSSGRTSYINTIKTDKTFIVETKAIRKNLTGNYDDTSADTVVIDRACDMCISALSSDLYDLVIFDSSTLKNQRRIQIFRRMCKYADVLDLVIIDCDPAICIKRDNDKAKYLKRGKAHILESFRDFEEPNDAVKLIYDEIIRIDGEHILDEKYEEEN